MSTCTVGQQQMPVGLGQGQASYVQPLAAAPVGSTIYDMYLDKQYPGIYRIADGGYVDVVTRQYVKSKDSVVLCAAHVLHPDIAESGFSKAGTNFIYDVIFREVLQPLSKGKSPEKYQQVFKRVQSFLRSDLLPELRSEMWHRTKNIATSKHFKNLFTEMVLSLMKNSQYTKSLAVDAVLTKPNSLADAIGCEAYRRFYEAQKELIDRKRQLYPS